MTRAIYTPAILAERWECSERQVRLMIDRGELPAFRLGAKLLRIRAEDVEAFECQSGDLPDCGENGASPGQTHPSHQGGDVIDWAHQTRKRRPAAPRLDTQNSHGLKGQR